MTDEVRFDLEVWLATTCVIFPYVSLAVYFSAGKNK
jgi:hypothetical protein